MTRLPRSPRPVIVVFALASLLTSAAAAQPPTYVRQWGSQGSGPGQFIWPADVAVDASGNVYVADSGNNRIQEFTSLGVFIQEWATSCGTSPVGVAVDANGTVYVANRDGGTYGAGCIETRPLSGGGIHWSGWFGDMHFVHPAGVAVDHDGNVFVSDNGYHHVEKFTSSGAFVTRWGFYGTGDGSLQFPVGIAVDAGGRVYVVDHGRNRIEVFSNSGAYLAQFGGWQFGSLYGLEVDADGNVYTTDSQGGLITKCTSDGVFIAQWGAWGEGIGEFRNPLGVAADTHGNIYVADTDNHRIQVFGWAPTPTKSQSWARLKSLYR